MFIQVFGDSGGASSEVDTVTSVEFNDEGDYLATGDRGGRIVIFKKNSNFSRKNKPPTSARLSSQDYEWLVHHQFQSHDQDFDYLKSLEIEEKINCITWCRPSGGQHSLLSTNDKTVKLWKIGPKKIAYGNKISSLRDGVLSLKRSGSEEISIHATPKHIYANAHAYNINSTSVNSDGETFLSADDLRINWWSKEVTHTCFNIVDIKPSNMEELTEVITSARFHPHHCNILMYSSSRGTIKLCDTRASALCDRVYRTFEEPADPSLKSFFTEIVSSISDARFSTDGRYVVSRDYLTLKVWDTVMERAPVKIVNINNRVKSMLCELYESDSIFDKFEVSVSQGGDRMLTGSYGNQFTVWDKEGSSAATVDINSSSREGGAFTRSNKDSTEIDFESKILHCSWSPTSNMVALAAQARLYLYKV